MKLFNSCLALLLITMPLAAQNTITLTGECLGATITLDSIGTDATGRIIYLDNAPPESNTQIQLFFDATSMVWQVGIPGNIFYTAASDFAPKPPDSGTVPYLATSLCGAAIANATVSGPGTQASQGGDPCADLGGDDDNDGVCNDNDACPGFDDNIDPDMDGIPSGCDPNPNVADGFLIASACIDPNDSVLLTADGDDGNGRNIYRNTTLQLEVVWNSETVRWEVRAIGNPDNVFFFNTLASVPKPPSSTVQAWESGNACGGQIATVSGSGTQDEKCDVSVCDDDNPCTDESIDADCNCIYTSNDTERPVVTCDSLTVYLGEDGTYPVNAEVEGGFTVMDNCGIADTTFFVDNATCELSGASVRYNSYVTVTDLAGLRGFCDIIVTVLDTLAPTLVCQQDTVYLDDQGMGSYNEADLFTAMDNCGVTDIPVGEIRQVNCDTVGSILEYVVSGVLDAIENEALPCTATVTVLDTFTMSACPPNSVTVLVNGRDRLLPNFPNPVIESTTIPFVLAAAGTVTLRVYDLSGRPLWQRQMNGLAGENQVVIRREELGAAGVLTYTLTTETSVATGKMIVR